MSDDREPVYISYGKNVYDPCCRIEGNVDEGEYNLLIHNVSVSEVEREWQCVHVQADPQRQNATITVIVPVAEITIEKLPKGNISTAKPVYVCEAKRGKPAAIITLFKDGNPVGEDEVWSMQRVVAACKDKTEDTLAIFVPKVTDDDDVSVLFCQAIQIPGNIRKNSKHIYVNVSQSQDDDDLQEFCSSPCNFGYGLLLGILIAAISAVLTVCIYRYIKRRRDHSGKRKNKTRDVN
ncbi:uncharacterized protein [Ptychodera flava]|uniref:uncharacterized protein isoform X1 n=1 Tax=Ptychodera flava TaxID=63121 RepID=UPI00396A75B8